MRKGRARRRFLVCLAVAVAFVLMLVAAPALMQGDPNVTNPALALRAPGQDGFVLGSDSLGRDVLARTVAGGWESIVLGFGVVAVIVAIGMLVGLAAGYFGGAVDYVLSKVITAFQAFPSFVLAVAIAGILGQGLANMVIAIAAVYWTQYARLVRGMTISFKRSECIDAARMCGAGPVAIVRRYLIPQMIGPVAILSVVSMSDIILTMAGLSFVGLGPERPTNEWGAMMADAQATFQYAPWCMLVPMAGLFLAVVIFNLLGDTLRDALDVRSQDVPARPILVGLKGRLGRRDAKPMDETIEEETGALCSAEGRKEGER
ncbi:MAG: ABC transporter permease [Coriobacteriales bacterium]